jgi:hypothetical protein
LVRAQQSVQTNAIKQAMYDTGEAARIYPEVTDLLNSDAAMRMIYRQRGMPASCVRSAEEVAGIRQARQQAQQEADRKAQMEKLAGGALGAYDALAVAPQEGSPAAALLGGGQMRAIQQ